MTENVSKILSFLETFLDLDASITFVRRPKTRSVPKRDMLPWWRQIDWVEKKNFKKSKIKLLHCPFKVLIFHNLSSFEGFTALNVNFLVPQANRIKQCKDYFLVKGFAANGRKCLLTITCLLEFNVSMTTFGSHAHYLAILFSSLSNISNGI